MYVCNIITVTRPYNELNFEEETLNNKNEYFSSKPLMCVM